MTLLLYATSVADAQVYRFSMWVDGAPDVAKIQNPAGIAADRSGNVFVTDSGTHTICRIELDGKLTTVAGMPGVTGDEDGTGSAARFRGPGDITVDGLGNLYVTDGLTPPPGTPMPRIRKITPAGVVTTLPPLGFVPYSVRIAADSSGNLFVAGLVHLTKVAADGQVSTLTNRSGAPLNINWPLAFAVDAADNLYETDRDGVIATSWINRISSTGDSSVFAGAKILAYGGLSYGSADGVGSAAGFAVPEGLAIDSDGDLYVADTGNATIRKVTPDARVVTIGGSAGIRGNTDGIGSLARFTSPTTLTVDGRGNLFIIDSGVIREGVPLQDPPRLTNFSVLADLAAGESMTVGAMSGGDGTAGTKPFLVRAVGPALVPFGLTQVLGDPVLALYSGATAVGQNDDWEPALATKFAEAGAFPFPTGSKDAALYAAAVPAGSHTMRVLGNGSASGTVLAEIYDGTPAETLVPTTSRLINASVLKNVADVLTAGFYFGGNGSRRVLIRAVGPSLSAVGLDGVMSDPTVELSNGQGRVVASNDNWNGDAQIVSVSTRVGAFPLAGSSSKDAAALATLTPGNYTLIVRRNPGTTTGLVLLEIYEVP